MTDQLICRRWALAVILDHRWGSPGLLRPPVWIRTEVRVTPLCPRRCAGDSLTRGGSALIPGCRPTTLIDLPGSTASHGKPGSAPMSRGTHDDSADRHGR